RYFHSNLCRVQLCHSRLYGIGFLGSLRHSRTIYQILSSLNLGRHISKLELGVLELADGSSELLSFFYISNGSLKSAFRKSKSLSGDTDSSAVQSMHGDMEAFALLA